MIVELCIEFLLESPKSQILKDPRVLDGRNLKGYLTTKHHSDTALLLFLFKAINRRQQHSHGTNTVTKSKIRNHALIYITIL